MKIVVGAGILSLPYTVSRLGYLLSLVMYIILIAVVQFSCTMLLRAKNLSKHSKYSTICYHIFRNRISRTICPFLIMLSGTCVCIAEFVIIKGSVGRIFDGYIQDKETRDTFFLSSYFIVIVCAILECPLTLFRKIEKLRFFAFGGVSGVSVFVLALSVVFFTEMS